MFQTGNFWCIGLHSKHLRHLARASARPFSFFLYLLILEKGSKRERNTEIVVSLIYALTGCPLYVPAWGLNLQPWRVGRCSNPPSHVTRRPFSRARTAEALAQWTQYLTVLSGPRHQRPWEMVSVRFTSQHRVHPWQFTECLAAQGRNPSSFSGRNAGWL